MAEGHLLKAKIVDSEKFRSLDGDDFTQKVYLLLVACVDSWGMMQANKWNLKAKLDPNGKAHPPEDYERAIRNLSKIDLIQTWIDQGSEWLYVLGHDQEQKLKYRKKNPDVIRPPHQPRSKIDPGSELDRSRIDPRSPEVEVEVEDEIEVEGKKQHRASRSTPPLDLLLQEKASEQVAKDFITFRKAKKGPITSIVIGHIKRESEKAGITFEQALIECCARNWQTFNSEWYANAKNGGNGGKPQAATKKSKSYSDSDWYRNQPAKFWVALADGKRPFSDPSQREALNDCRAKHPEWF